MTPKRLDAAGQEFGWRDHDYGIHDCYDLRSDDGLDGYEGPSCPRWLCEVIGWGLAGVGVLVFLGFLWLIDALT